MENLTSFSLSLSQCFSLTEESLRILCHDGIKHLWFLTNLHLCFFDCPRISHIRLSYLQDEINSLPLPCLQPLAKIDDPRQILSQAHPVLSKTPRPKFHQSMLQEFRNHKIMHAKAWKSGDKSLYSSADMESLKKREALRILFGYLQSITDPLTRHLTYGLHRPFKSDILNFNFEIIGKISDDGLRALSSKGIQNGMELTKLSLHFKGEIATKRGLADLSEKGIGSLKQLKALHLNFNECENFTDEDLICLTEGGLQNLKPLNTLHISLSGCRHLTDQGVASLCSSGIQNLKELKTLYLNFDGCNQLTDEALKSVSLKGILSLSGIENLELSFLNCPKISPASYQAFLKILSYFGYVKVDQNSNDSENPKDPKDSEDVKDSKAAEDPEVLLAQKEQEYLNQEHLEDLLDQQYLRYLDGLERRNNREPYDF